MAKNNLEDELRNLKKSHLTDGELYAYCDRELGLMGRARVEAHVKECFRCKEELAMLLEESETVSNRGLTVEPLTRPLGTGAELSGASTAGPSLLDRLAEAVQHVMADWQAYFGQLRPVHRGGESGREVWRLEGKDVVLRVWAVLEKNTDLTIHFASDELSLNGVSLKIGLGRFTQEITLQKQPSGSEVHAIFVVPKQKRPKDLSGISVEVV